MTVNNVQEVSVSQLKIGMFVCALDRPWLETPYLMQGFHILTPDDIEEIKTHCEYVYIDIEKQKSGHVYTSKTRDNAHRAPKTTADKQKASVTDLLTDGRSSRTQAALEKMFSGRTLLQYKDQAPADVELENARQVCLDLNNCVKGVLESVSSGRSVDVTRVKDAVSPMIDSVLRNPDACMWLARLKNRDSYTYKHSMGASIWSVALGRQIGLPKIDLKVLATGALLCDIGKLRLPEGLLNKNEKLSRGEFAMIRSHVELGLSVLSETENINPKVIRLVANHHERHDGSGYPNKIKGNDIPVLARIAAIADCYDAMTSDRIYAKAISPSMAVRKLFEWRGKEFQAELVEEFIQSVGLYPAGTLVELSTGEVAIVISESRSRRLRPKVLLLMDADKKPRSKFLMFDMMADSDEGDEGEGVYIKQSLGPGDYGIDPESIYY